MTRRSTPDILGRGFSSPPGCRCDGYYYDQHDDSGCPYYVDPPYPIRHRLRDVWRVLFGV